MKEIESAYSLRSRISASIFHGNDTEEIIRLHNEAIVEAIVRATLEKAAKVAEDGEYMMWLRDIDVLDSAGIERDKKVREKARQEVAKRIRSLTPADVLKEEKS